MPQYIIANLNDLSTYPYAYTIPLTGSTVAIGSGIVGVVLNPAGELATLTVSMPTSPFDGQIVELSSTQAIDALTVVTLDGSTIVGGVRILSQFGGCSWRYSVASTTWFPRY